MNEQTPPPPAGMQFSQAATGHVRGQEVCVYSPVDDKSSVNGKPSSFVLPFSLSTLFVQSTHSHALPPHTLSPPPTRPISPQFNQTTYTRPFPLAPCTLQLCSMLLSFFLEKRLPLPSPPLRTLRSTAILPTLNFVHPLFPPTREYTLRQEEGRSKYPPEPSGSHLATEEVLCSEAYPPPCGFVPPPSSVILCWTRTQSHHAPHKPVNSTASTRLFPPLIPCCDTRSCLRLRRPQHVWRLCALPCDNGTRSMGGRYGRFLLHPAPPPACYARPRLSPVLLARSRF